METHDTANIKPWLLDLYKRDLAEAQRTIEVQSKDISALQGERDEFLKRSEAYLALAVMFGLIAAFETIALLVLWGAK